MQPTPTLQPTLLPGVGAQTWAARCLPPVALVVLGHGHEAA